jgi:condensin complex subunit 3
MSTMHRALDEDEDMVSPAQVAGMFVDWTDPQKIITAA